MNKKEGIGKYKVGQQVAICGFIEEINIENLRDIENTTHLVINTLTRTIDVNPKYETVITDLNKPKPVVPQYVADWYEDIKEDFENKLFGYIRNFHIYKSRGESKDFNFWFDNNKNAIQILVNMNQFGYEVEKETEYEVLLKKTPQILLYDEKNEEYYFAVHRAIFSREYHTRKELEEGGFGWVFDCDGVEVKEVK